MFLPWTSPHSFTGNMFFARIKPERGVFTAQLRVVNVCVCVGGHFRSYTDEITPDSVAEEDVVRDPRRDNQRWLKKR